MPQRISSPTARRDGPNTFLSVDATNQSSASISLLLAELESSSKTQRVSLASQRLFANAAAFPTLQQTASEITRLMGPYSDAAAVETRPSDGAYVRAQQLVLWLADAGFPYGASDVYTDQDDALRLQWNGEGRQLKMVFPFAVAENPYLYFSSGDEFDVDANPKPDQILRRLKWVFGLDDFRQRVA